MNFIYVNTEEARDMLLAHGATMMSFQEKTSLWAFRVDDVDNLNFDLIGDYVISNVLMF